MARPLISFYGDDFTGSTDAMEALASNGIKTVLFLDRPDDALFSRFSDASAFGLAGTSRSQSPDWMVAHLAPAFQWLKTLDADFCHYKVCSTFDSSPVIGSIGRAMELGLEIFENKAAPLVVGAPQIRRYTAFGHLFAAYQGRNYRIDRHPVMSRHPVTPMVESDVLMHLAGQTGFESRLVDIAALAANDADDVVDRAFAEARIVHLDVDGEESQVRAGQQLLRKKAAGGQFVCGSSGVEYALIKAWKAEGRLGPRPEFADVGRVDKIAVVSGSVSPTTERQIRHAGQNGFGLIPVDALALSGERSGGEIADAVASALACLERGQSPLVYSALGPEADQSGRLSESEGARHRLGENLGLILSEILNLADLQRAVIAGGDTSSHALSKLGIDALTLLMPLPQAPGSPLCLAHGGNGVTNGLQIALKGGQVGQDDYFSFIRNGRAKG